jgi:uncharacterized protein (UPF0210 family)
MSQHDIQHQGADLNIRTITVGAREEDLGRAAQAAHRAKELLTTAGYTVQTLRLALSMTGSNRCADFVSVARGAEEQALDAGFDLLSLGRVEVDRLDQVPDAIAATQSTSMSVKIAGRNGMAEPGAIRAAAQAVVAIAHKTPEGFGNFRFGSTACMGPGTPFFPAAFHDGSVPRLAIGPEAASLAFEATGAGDSQADRAPTRPIGSSVDTSDRTRPIPRSIPRLTALIEQHDQAIKAALGEIEGRFGVFVSGCDWSLAPSPQPASSIGAAIEALTGLPFGSWGTLAAIRSLTDSIQGARVNRLGFSGVMLPVLEDAVLAERGRSGPAGERGPAFYTLRDLLAFSAVCGTGLDTIPLPGATTVSQVVRILSEVANLGGALRKPLIARLIPLPGREAGAPTAIDFQRFPDLEPFLCQTRVLEVF